MSKMIFNSLWTKLGTSWCLPGRPHAASGMLLWRDIFVFSPDICDEVPLWGWWSSGVSAGRLSNCSHPLVPEHGGFRCDPSPCRGFPLKSTIHFFCEAGYHISNKVYVSRCRHGRWQPPVPACIPIKGETVAHSRTFDRWRESRLKKEKMFLQTTCCDHVRADAVRTSAGN